MKINKNTQKNINSCNLNYEFKLGCIDDWFSVESIYFEAFPINERQTSETVQKRILNNDLKLYVVVAANQYVGFALVWDLKQITSYYIEYLAVSVNARNNGIGKFILSSIKECLENKKIIVEIEDVIGLEQDYSNINRLRRIQFYEKSDFKIIKNVTYEMPSLVDDNEAIPMLLYYFSFKKEIVKKEDLKLFIEFLYLKIYNKNEENTFLKKIINTIK